MAEREAEGEYTFQKPEGLLAHYTSAAVAFEHILPSGQLRMSPYRRMRSGGEQGHRAGHQLVRRPPPDPEEALGRMIGNIKAVRDSMRLLSFTRDAAESGGLNSQFDCCWARPRMWEQYGDSHRGACLLFHRGRLEQTLQRELKEMLYLGDVRYTREGIAGSATSRE